ncbi:MAG: tyrosine-type recombinase/integrase [Clostridiales bacterium]|nr:tyrosine-type recombinase/integrase [Clostridiales bacterium]
MPELSYREQLDQKRLETIRLMLRTLPRSCADFIRSLLSTTSTLTRLAYTIDLGTFFDFAMKELACFAAENASDVTDEDIARLKPRDIEIYADYLSLYFRSAEADAAEQRMLKNHTYGIMRKLSTLRSYFNYLFRTQRIPANIVALVPLPKKHEKPILLLEHDEMQKLLDAVANGDRQLTPRQAAYHRLTRARDFAIVMLFLGTGIRVSECVGINLEDVDLTNRALLVTRKGGNQVILYFPDEVAEALREYLQQRQTVNPEAGHEHAFFLSLQRRRMTQRTMEQMVKKYAMLVVPLKKRMSPHKLRSTYATNLYHETEDIYLVAEALGHSDVNTTRKHYASMSDARMRQAALHTRLNGAGLAAADAAVTPTSELLPDTAIGNTPPSSFRERDEAQSPSAIITAENSPANRPLSPTFSPPAQSASPILPQGPGMPSASSEAGAEIARAREAADVQCVAFSEPGQRFEEPLPDADASETKAAESVSGVAPRPPRRRRVLNREYRD